MMTRIQSKLDSAKKMLAAKRAESYVDSGVKILIAVVIGLLFLGLVYALWNDTIRADVTSKVSEIFGYSGK